MSETFSSGNVPLITSTQRQILVKILNSLNAGGGGGSGAFLSGTGSPAGVQNSTQVGQTYFDTAGNNFWVSSATGTGGWVELIQGT